MDSQGRAELEEKPNKNMKKQLKELQQSYRRLNEKLNADVRKPLEQLKEMILLELQAEPSK